MSTCQCPTWARTDGRMTNHHPNCEQFKEETFVRVQHDDSAGYIIPIGDVASLSAEVESLQDGESIRLQRVRMTREEYEATPEFQGV